MAINWCPGTIVRKQVWAEGLFTIHVRVDGVQEFLPGQFLQLGIQKDDEHIHRPYSVASPWGPVLEFFIIRVDGGQLTPHLWDLEVGAEIDVSQRAAGSFTLKKTPPAKTLWLIATGTGLAPYVAMLRTESPWQIYQRIVVVHGARLAQDLAYVEEFASVGQQRPGKFAYLPALTREQPEGVLAGRIPGLLQDGSLESAAGCELGPESSSVMLCGNPAMLDDMEKMLEDRGMKRHRSKSPGHIVLERYW